MDFERISTIDTYTITPAENPRLIERNFEFLGFEKRDIKPPIAVDNPAIRVSEKAMITLFKIIPISVNLAQLVVFRAIISICEKFFCVIEVTKTRGK